MGSLCLKETVPEIKVRSDFSSRVHSDLAGFELKIDKMPLNPFSIGGFGLFVLGLGLH